MKRPQKKFHIDNWVTPK